MNVKEKGEAIDVGNGNVEKKALTLKENKKGRLVGQKGQKGQAVLKSFLLIQEKQIKGKKEISFHDKKGFKVNFKVLQGSFERERNK